MKNRKTIIMLSLVLITSIVKAQNAQTTTAKDSLQERKELMALMSKYPNRGTFYPEEFGEQLIDSSKEELIRRLATSKDKIELRKIAQILGDRAMAKTLKLTDSETAAIDKRIRAYILQKADFYGDNSEVHDQILRFWDLAIPEMLRHLEHPNADVRAFVFNTLVQMRSENVVRIMINKAKVCKDIRIKEMYIGILGFMTQQEDMNLPNRQCMSVKDSEELFVRLIQPAKS